MRTKKLLFFAFFEDFSKIPDNVVAQRAVTEYKVLGEASGLLTWILFSPKTGRTHQLRVHCAEALGNPILGDRLYGMQNAARLMLHARELSFIHPHTGERLCFTCTPEW